MKTYGLIGYPLTHSFSKSYFLNKFEKEKIEEVKYLNLPISSIKLFPDVILTIENLAGLNVTSPYKEIIICYLEDLDPIAEEIGAVNTVKVIYEEDKRKLIGYNTDAFGFSESLKPLLSSTITNALILGTGGAAKAVAYGLKSLGIKYNFVSSQKKLSGTNILHYSDLNKSEIEQNLLIVNATPLGLYPKINSKPNIPYEYISDKHLLFDLNYNPEKTLFLKQGEKKGARIKNGYEMLELQAEKAWEIFHL